MNLSTQYINWIQKVRKAKQLHGIVENRLIQILNKIIPEYNPIKEPQGLAGGRNDLMLFEFNGRKILFEIFATKNQVSRDLRILDKTKANKKIAVIIDKEVDNGVFEKFIKENPEDNYPFIFIGELFEKSLIHDCALKLNELIRGDEDAKFLRMLNQKISHKNFIEICKKKGIDIITKEDIKEGNITFQKIFVTFVLRKLQNLGVKKDYLMELGKWMSETKLIEFIARKIDWGFNLFLYTNFKGHMAIYSSIELLDWIRIGYEFTEPHILLPINSIIHDIVDKYFNNTDNKIELNKNIIFNIGQSSLYETENGRIVNFSIPKNAKEIRIFKPYLFYKKGEKKPKELSYTDYLNMMEFY